MMTEDACERALNGLRTLPAIAPDLARSEDVRARCHARLARKRSSDAKVKRSAAFMLEQALFGALGVFYFSALVIDAFRLSEIL